MINIKFRELPHFDERPAGAEIDTLIVHSMHSLKSGCELDPLQCLSDLDGHKVASHYLIAQDGEIWQIVDEAKRAWHAGVSRMPADGRENVNNFSIGVELVSLVDRDFPEAQYESLAKLTADIMKRRPIRHILGHEHIAPGRKTDPGPRFDWKLLKSKLESAGLEPSRISLPAQ